MSMTLCEDRHEAVVFEDYNYRSKRRNPCPVCEVLDREAVLQEQVEDLQKQLDAEKGKRP